MADDTPPPTVAKRLDTPLAVEYAELNVICGCLVEGDNALRLYFDMMKIGPQSEKRQTILAALFRDGLIQVMSCFTTNPAKRNRYLLPKEAFAGIAGWEEFYQWMLDYRDAFAAHNFGAKRLCYAVAHTDPKDNSVVGVGHFGMNTLGEGLEAAGEMAKFVAAAKRHAAARLDDLGNRVLEETKKLSAEEIAALPECQIIAPGPDDVRTSRERYQAQTAPKRPQEG